MQKQVYSLQHDNNIVSILKNTEVVYEISVGAKSIFIADLYSCMKVGMDDEYFFANGLKKYDAPKNDSERIFNNTYDFLNSLLASLNKKLKELREKQNEITF